MAGRLTSGRLVQREDMEKDQIFDLLCEVPAGSVDGRLAAPA